MELEPGDIVLCTVEKIEKTIVFVNIEGNGQGSIVTSEISPGRIRNIRDFVVPNKKIVCKVLRVSGDRIDLSLRRVTQKERKELLERYQQEKSFISLFKTILGEKSEKILEKIKNSSTISEFVEEIKQNPKNLEKFIDKKDSEKILEIINNQKKKKSIVKKEILFSTNEGNGLEIIKEILGNIKEFEIRYISAGKYSITKESEDLKKADNAIKQLADEILKKSKKYEINFSIK